MPTEADNQPVRPARACIFCGGTPVTKEHLVGRWAVGLLAKSNGTSSSAATSQRAQQPGDTRQWRARAIDRQARVVCEPCNSGWMSDLETAVSLSLDVSALDGRPLNPDEGPRPPPGHEDRARRWMPGNRPRTT